MLEISLGIDMGKIVIREVCVYGGEDCGVVFLFFEGDIVKGVFFFFYWILLGFYMIFGIVVVNLRFSRLVREKEFSFLMLLLR